MTQVAQPYPLGLCRLLAVALAQQAGWCRAEKMSVAACAKCGSARIGEAKNPGPRRRVPSVRTTALHNVQLLSGQTLALEARLLDEFATWC